MQLWTPFWEQPRWEISASIFRYRIQNIKELSSIAILKEVGALLEAEGYVIENIDATIIAQRPKLAAYRPQMEKILRGTASGVKPGERQGNYGGGAGLHRKW